MDDELNLHVGDQSPRTGAPVAQHKRAEPAVVDQRWRTLSLAICAVGREEGVDGRLRRVLLEACAVVGAGRAMLVLDSAVHVDQVLVSTGDPADAAELQARMRSAGFPLGAGEVPTAVADRPDWLAAPVFTESARYAVLSVFDPVGRASFSGEDFTLLSCLADTTGTGLDCAVASVEAHQHQTWLQASAAIGEKLATLDGGRS